MLVTAYLLLGRGATLHLGEVYVSELLEASLNVATRAAPVPAGPL